jgi:hypothetical protein
LRGGAITFAPAVRVEARQEAPTSRSSAWRSGKGRPQARVGMSKQGLHDLVRLDTAARTNVGCEAVASQRPFPLRSPIRALDDARRREVADLDGPMPRSQCSDMLRQNATLDPGSIALQIGFAAIKGAPWGLQVSKPIPLAGLSHGPERRRCAKSQPSRLDSRSGDVADHKPRRRPLWFEERECRSQA